MRHLRRPGGHHAGANERVRVAFIAGAGLSGSTLLEQALAQVDDCVSIGELHWLWKPYWESMVCECGLEFASCPFWTRVVDRAYGSRHVEVRRAVDQIGEGFLRHSVLPALRHSRTRFRAGAAFRELGELIAPVYRAVSAESGGSIIVDATKSALWGFAVASPPDVDATIVHLVRDPSGFASSNGRSRAAPGPPGVMTTPYGAARSYANWALANVEAEVLARRSPSSIVVLYEQLARDPAAVVTRVTDAIGASADVTKVIADNVLVVGQLGHAIGGNPRRPRGGSTLIKPDARSDGEQPRARRVLRPLVAPLWHHYERQAGRDASSARRHSFTGVRTP